MTREDKEAIIRRVEAMYGEAEDNETKEALFYAIEALKEHRPYGKWIDLGDDMILRWICSKCGRKDSHIFNFCPDCGANMKEEGEAEC